MAESAAIGDYAAFDANVAEEGDKYWRPGANCKTYHKGTQRGKAAPENSKG